MYIYLCLGKVNYLRDSGFLDISRSYYWFCRKLSLRDPIMLLASVEKVHLISYLSMQWDTGELSASYTWLQESSESSFLHCHVLQGLWPEFQGRLRSDRKARSHWVNAPKAARRCGQWSAVSYAAEGRPHVLGRVLQGVGVLSFACGMGVGWQLASVLLQCLEWWVIPWGNRAVSQSSGKGQEIACLTRHHVGRRAWGREWQWLGEVPCSMEVSGNFILLKWMICISWLMA